MKLAPRDDVILGMDWMHWYRVVLDVLQGIVTVITEDGMRHICQKWEAKD